MFSFLIKTKPVPVIAYHRVLPFSAPLAITAEEFERQLCWLKRNGYNSLTGEELSNYLAGELIVQRPCVITFDDGYLDNLYLAAPLLKKYGFKSLIFVITSKIRNHQDRNVGKWDEQGDDVFLSWEELDEMSHSGQFQVHTHTHTHTKYWTDEVSPLAVTKLVVDDVMKSLEILRGRYTYDIQLAWPWGFYRDAWLTHIANLGVSICYTMHPGTNYYGCNQMLVRRLDEKFLRSDGKCVFRMSASATFGSYLNALADIRGRLYGKS